MPKVSAKRQITLPVEQCNEVGIKPGGEYPQPPLKMLNLFVSLDRVIKTYRLCVNILFQPMDELQHLYIFCYGLLEPVAPFPIFTQDLMP